MNALAVTPSIMQGVLVTSKRLVCSVCEGATVRPTCSGRSVCRCRLVAEEHSLTTSLSLRRFAISRSFLCCPLYQPSLAASQLGFIDFLCIPLLRTWVQLIPEAEVYLRSLEVNRAFFASPIQEQREQREDRENSKSSKSQISQISISQTSQTSSERPSAER